MPKYYFFYLTDRDNVDVPSSYSKRIGDIAYLAEEDENCRLIISNKLKMDSKGGLFVNNISCNTSNSVFLVDDSVYEAILLDYGFRAINFSLTKTIAKNKIFCQYFLRSKNIKVPPFSLNIPRESLPFIAKTSDHSNGNGTELIRNLSQWDEISNRKYLSKRQHHICEFYIRKPLQCDYKIYIFVDTILAVLFRVNLKINTFDPKIGSNGLEIPLKPPRQLKRYQIPIEERGFSTIKKVLTDFKRKIKNDEFVILKDALKQEKILVNEHSVPVITNNFPPIHLARKVAETLRLGLCEIHITTDRIGVPYVLDVNPEVGANIAKVCDKKLLYNLIKDRISFE